MIATMLAISASAQTLTSPDGNLVMKFELTKKGKPTYTLSYKGQEVVRPSALGFEFVDNAYENYGAFYHTPKRPIYSMREGFSLKGTETATFDNPYGASAAISAITITSFWSSCIVMSANSCSISVSASTTTDSASVTSFRNRHLNDVHTLLSKRSIPSSR